MSKIISYEFLYRCDYICCNVEVVKFVLILRYLLAVVFIYFKRAHLKLVEFSEYNFWVALYIAHDMFEDAKIFKWDILPWAFGDDWKDRSETFFRSKATSLI